MSYVTHFYFIIKSLYRKFIIFVKSTIFIQIDILLCLHEGGPILNSRYFNSLQGCDMNTRRKQFFKFREFFLMLIFLLHFSENLLILIGLMGVTHLPAYDSISFYKLEGILNGGRYISYNNFVSIRFFHCHKRGQIFPYSSTFKDHWIRYL